MKAIGIILMLALTSCSSGIIVKTDYDRDINLKPYTTYSWVNSLVGETQNPLYYNELNDKRIKKAVNEQMALKGYTLVSDQGEITLHYHLVIESKSELRSDPYSYYGPYWMRPRINSYQYDEGTLIIDVLEAKSNALGWRGWATSIIDADRNLKEELLTEAAVEIFKAYPYSVPKRK